MEDLCPPPPPENLSILNCQCVTRARSEERACVKLFERRFRLREGAAAGPPAATGGGTVRRHAARRRASATRPLMPKNSWDNLCLLLLITNMAPVWQHQRFFFSCAHVHREKGQANKPNVQNYRHSLNNNNVRYSNEKKCFIINSVNLFEATSSRLC